MRARVGVQGGPRVRRAAGAGPDGVGIAAGAAAILPCQCTQELLFIFQTFDSLHV
jgi:hypothetical protein